MSNQTINEKGEILVTTSDLTTLEKRLLDGVEALEKLHLEAKLIRLILAEALDSDLEPEEVEE